MSLTYGGTTYRSLEEQVRKNMEDISTEAASLAALTDKVDNLKTGGEKVSLTFPAGASSGTVTDEQLATLQENDENYIEMVNDKELYYLNDPGHEEGFLTYSHVGIENSKATIKTLTITISAKSFVIVTTVVPTDAGGKLYLHNLTFNAYGVSGVQAGGLINITFERYSSSSTPATSDDFYNLFPTNRPVVSASYTSVGNAICAMRCTPKTVTPSGTEIAGKIQEADLYFASSKPGGSTVDNSGLIKGVDLVKITEGEYAYPIRFVSDTVTEL